MRKIVLFTVTLFICMPLLAQDYKKLGDAKAAEGDYAGAAAMYGMGVENKDDECALALFKLIYNKKIEAEYSGQLNQLIQPLALKGRAEAQFYLGAMYEHGIDVTLDRVKALEWYRKAAEQRYTDAIPAIERLTPKEEPVVEVKKDTIPVVIPEKIAEIPPKVIPKAEPETAKPIYTTPKSKLKTSFGVLGGLNLANISGADFSPKMKTGFHIGALLNIRFGALLGLQPELLFSQQGFKTNDDNCTFNYLSLPIMIKLYISNGLHIAAGPYFSYLLGVSPESITVNGPKAVISDLKGGLDAGACLGVGYDTALGLTVGARYMLGLSDLAGNIGWKNNVISVSVGWMF